MNGIFHYYTCGVLARKAGFSPEDASVIATSANLPDHNLIPLTIDTGGKPYKTIATHHFGFWDRSQEDSVWLPFHFFPGGASKWDETPITGRAGVSPADVVVPDSAPAKELLREALHSRNLYRIGIALHTYADTWAHEGFTGRNEATNILDRHSQIPPIGHAQAGRNPDVFSLVWFDPRRSDPFVNNKLRFLASARKIYRYLCTYLAKPFDDEDFVLAEIEELVGSPGPRGSADARAELEVKAAEYLPRLASGLASVPLGFPESLSDLRDRFKEIGRSIRDEIGIGRPANPAVQIGRSDEELEIEFLLLGVLEKYNRSTWKRAALEIKGREAAEDSQESTNDKFIWLRHEILNKTRLFSPQPVKARPGFEESHYFNWMEAARAHLRSAELTLRNI